MRLRGVVETVAEGTTAMPCVMLDVSGFTVDALAMSTDAAVALHTAHATGFRHRGGNFRADPLPRIIRPQFAFDRSCQSISVRRETYRVQRGVTLSPLITSGKDRDIFPVRVTSFT